MLIATDPVCVRMAKNNRFDFLRLLAALLVLLNHSYPLSGLPGSDLVTQWFRLDTSGGLGVAIFFSISGYLVAISMETSSSVLAFARRRVFRIYPGLLVACLFCVLVVGPLASDLAVPDYFSNAASWHYMKTATGFENMLPLPGVFARNPFAFAVNGSLWSLPIELHCYIALALLSLVPLELRVKALAMVCALALLLIARPAANVWAPYFALNYYETKMGLMFAVGVLLAAWRACLSKTIWHGLGIVAMVLLALAWTLSAGLWQLMLYTTAMPVLTVWLALHGTFLPNIPPKMGDLSYGTYLYAFPIQQLLTHFHFPILGMPAYMLYTTLLTLACAAGSWHFVERPCVRWKYGVKSP